MRRTEPVYRGFASVLSRIFALAILGTPILILFGQCSLAASLSEDFVEGQLIIKVKSGVSNGALQSILNRNGLLPVGFIPDLNLMLVNLPNGALLDTFERIFSHDPNFEYVERNYLRRAILIPNDQRYGLQYYLPKIEAPQAWNSETGNSSVVIAVIDTGVQASHPDLSGKVLTGSNFVSFSSTTNTNDDNGHGTGVSGTAAVKTNNLTGVAGVCWECLILPVKVLNSTGSGSLFSVLEGIDFVANYAAQNPDKKVVINLSFGGPCGSGSGEQDAINNAWNNGVVIVAAAGNSGNSNSVCPAARANVLAVSATDENDHLASFSSFGGFVDVSAPGVNIVTTWNGSRYVSVSGTSFSSPIAAGVAGLIWSVNPSLTNAQVVQMVEDTADDLGLPGYDVQFGHGRVNAYTAVQAAGGSPVPTPIPTPTPLPTPPSSDTTLPSIAITQPGNGAFVSGTVKIKASASDNVGVANVKFYVDDDFLATDGLSPYSATWNSSAASRGSHTLKAVATDTSGNTASDQITVFKSF